MKNHIYFNWSFLVAVFVGYALAQDINEKDKKFLKNLDCVATSEDQDLCDQYVTQCNTKLNAKYLQAYNDCVSDMLPNDVGKCTDGEELYGSSDMRKEVNKCIFEQAGAPQDDDDEQSLADVGQCTQDLAEKAGCAEE